MSQLKAGYGKVTFTRTSGTWLAALVTPPFTLKGITQALEKVEKSRTVVYPATDHQEINGAVYSSHMTVEDGAIILLQAQHRARGARLREGAIFIRARDSGPFIRVLARTVPAMESKLPENFIMFEGRGDVLDEVDLAHARVLVPKYYKTAYLVKEEINECFKVTSEAAQEMKEKPIYEEVVSAAGVVNIVSVAPPPRRKIRFKAIP